MMRPPPGCTPAHSARTYPPQADLNTNNSSRGRIGRKTSAGSGGAAGAAPGAAAEGTPAAAGVAAPPLAALTACSQFAESFDWFFCRHCSAAAPPVGTPAQFRW
jgi:hypothetical protein